MNVLILSQYYKPESIPKPSDLAEALARMGHSVSVVTGLPNYPSGSLFSGYRAALVQREVVDGIPVVRTFEYPYHGVDSLRRVLNYVSFMITAPLGSLRVARPDVMYVWHPPLTVGVAAWLIARLRGIPFVYDVQDIWPDSIVLSGMLRNKWIIRVLSSLERWVYRRADGIFCVTPGARENLIEKGAEPSKVWVMSHWVDENSFESVDDDARESLRRSYGWDGFVAMFAGNIGLLQGLETVVRAAALLRDEDGIRIALVGNGAGRERLRELANSLGVGDRIQFIDARPASEMPGLMAAADALVVHLKRAPIANWTIPTKTFAYLSGAKPIVMAMEGAAADLVRASGAGVVIPPDDPGALATALRELRSLSPSQRAVFGARGRSYLKKHFSKDRVIVEYEERLRAVAAVA